MRKVYTSVFVLCASLAALGGVLFAQAQSLEGLLAARALIGLGVSASLMAAIKASALWLPPERLPMSTAVLLAVGGLGAMASTAPMQLATDAVGWRMAFWGIAACAAAVLAPRARPVQAAAIKPVFSAALSHWRRGVVLFFVIVVSKGFGIVSVGFSVTLFKSPHVFKTHELCQVGKVVQRRGALGR